MINFLETHFSEHERLSNDVAKATYIEMCGLPKNWSGVSRRLRKKMKLKFSCEMTETDGKTEQVFWWNKN